MRSRKLSSLLIILLGLVMYSCANNYPVNTSSGMAEVTLDNMNIEEVRAIILNEFLNKGFYLRSENAYQLVFGIKDERFLMQLLAGSRYDSIPEVRYTFNIVRISGSVRIVGHIGIITNPGSAFERVIDISKNSRAAQELQLWLNTLKKEPEIPLPPPPRGRIGLKLKDGVITEVMPGSPAETAGLMVGDRILLINGAPLPTNVSEQISMLTGEPGTYVKLNAMRGSHVFEIEVQRGEP